MGFHSTSIRSPPTPVLTRPTPLRRAVTRSMATRRGTTTVFPVGEPGPRLLNDGTESPIKLLTNVEKLRLLSKAEKAGLLSTAERLGFSLSSVERLGLLSKAEELGVLSAAVDPGTPSALFNLSILLLILGPAFVYIVPEDQAWQVALQVAVALTSIIGGSAAFAASTFVSSLQRST